MVRGVGRQSAASSRQPMLARSRGMTSEAISSMWRVQRSRWTQSWCEVIRVSKGPVSSRNSASRSATVCGLPAMTVEAVVHGHLVVRHVGIVFSMWTKPPAVVSPMM